MLKHSFNGIAFNYYPSIDYSNHNLLSIRHIDKICTHCGAAKWPGEFVGICCSNSKVKVPQLEKPPEPLLTLLTEETKESKEFLQKIRKYNSCFQITSLGASGHIIVPDYHTSFTVQRQAYRHTDSILPLTEQRHSFLQIYFIGDYGLKQKHIANNIPRICCRTVKSIQ